MKKYIKPVIVEKKIIVNNFLTRNPFADPFSDFNNYFQIGSVYATSHLVTPKPPSSGNAGLKDETYQAEIRNAL